LSSLLKELDSRGLVAQITNRDKLESHLSTGSRTVYCGFDPTAASLHHGHLVPLLLLRRFQIEGHKPIALVGGATGLIGDPSFRSDERTLNEELTVAGWVERLQEQVSQFIDLGEGNNRGLVVNNLDWTRDLNTVNFLRDVGKHFSVNMMIARDAVKNRLERDGLGISYTEFSYMLLQAYDFLELHRRHNCTVQVGGNDQWGNMVSGVDLIRRESGNEAFVTTVPLITRSDGVKFGKTQGGALWLDPTMTSPYRFYQYWINMPDNDIEQFLRYFTFLESHRIDELGTEIKNNPGNREGQKILADEVTKIVHGQEGMTSAQRITQSLFGGKIRALEERDLDQLSLDGMDRSSIGDQENIVEAMADSGLARSRSDARKLLQSKGVQINGDLIDDPKYALDRAKALFGKYHVVRRGKKTWHLLVHAGI
jgi:tyrosyl-tRNA synthetase